MTHRRQTIRTALVTALTGLAATASRVYASRVYPLHADELPALRVYTPSDTADTPLVTSGVMPQLRNVRVVIEAVAKANSSADATVDTICEQVEAALTAAPTLSGAVLRLGYVAFEQDINGESDQQVVVGRMTFEAIATA